MHFSAQTCRQVRLIECRGSSRGLKNQDELFYYLHNTSKLKEVKANQLKEDKQKPMKKGTQAEVEDFLKRNE